MKPVQELLKELTIPEKAALLEGFESWMTNAVPRLGIPAVYLTDGPLGVRKKADAKGEGSLGLGNSHPSTAFPASVNIANGWSTENARRMGDAIGKECRAYDVQVLLGPALNLKRDPRCGRNFEYYSEDPLLAGKLAAAFTAGVQGNGTAACPKHFALNNSENYRYMGDSVVDERAARELYLKGFEICVRESRPRTMMCSYNKINGVHASENKWLLTDVLRGEWGYDGLVMTDWGATHERVAGVKAGLDLDMPGGVWENRKTIIQAVESGELDTETLDRAVANVLGLVEAFQKTEKVNEQLPKMLLEHLGMATEIACDCAVLLKNNGILPLDGDEHVLVVGELFEKMRYQGAGSSGLNPAHLISPMSAFHTTGTKFDYVRGYREISGEVDVELEIEALSAAKNAETILFFGGLTELFESEGYDRKDLSLPDNQLSLIRKLCAVGKRVIVVLFGGSVIELPFAEEVSAILHMFLPGEGGGEATRRVLYGEAEPAGRLSETWMKTVSDIPFGEHFSTRQIEQYRENIYVGYRFFDEAPERIRYPFGYGLSYTRFAYDDLAIHQQDGLIRVEVTVENTGDRPGSEVVQLYLGKNENTAVFKAQKELKAFEKIRLAPGESRRITLTVKEAELAYYNTAEHRWVLENGEYPVFVAASAQDIRLSGSVAVSGQISAKEPYSADVIEAYGDIAACAVSDSVFEETIGRPIPSEPSAQPFTVETPIKDYRSSITGRFLYNCIVKGVAFTGRKIHKLPEGQEKDELIKSQRFLLELLPQNCARSLIQSSGGMVQMNIARAVTEFANGHILRAGRELLRRDKPLPLPCREKK